MAYTVLDLDTRQRLDNLCRLKARTRIITAMLPTVPTRVIEAHWFAAHGTAPGKGPAVSRPSSYLATMRTRLHASFALVTYLHTEATRINFIDAYISAYEIYAATFAQDEPKSFDWFHSLVQNYIDDKLALVICDCCDAQYIHNRADLVNDRNCPCHRLIVGKTDGRKGRRRQIQDIHDGTLDLFADSAMTPETETSTPGKPAAGDFDAAIPPK